MASVRIDFIRPSDPGLVKLHIYEAATKDGPFAEIETVTAIGTYPDYISYYTTTMATAIDYWFEIEWEDASGARTPRSIPVQGGTSSLVAQIVNRMLLRDPVLDETVAAQEAEAAISTYYNTLDPYSIDPTNVSPKILSGLTNLALVRSYMTVVITSTGSASKWTAGLVAMDTSSMNKTLTPDGIKGLLALANVDLGLSFSFIALIDEIEVAGGFKQLVSADLSRGIIEIA